MGDFFHSGRRKVGLLTLVMACFFVAAWVRSLSTVDLVQFGSRTRETNGFASASGLVGWFQWDRNNWTQLRQNVVSFQFDGRVWQSGPVQFFSLSTHGSPFFRPNHLLPFRVQIDQDLGPDRSRLESEGIWGPNVVATGTMVAIPYSLFVFFMTLLSSWLLYFPKSRKSTQKKNIEPFPERAVNSRLNAV